MSNIKSNSNIILDSEFNSYSLLVKAKKKRYKLLMIILHVILWSIILLLGVKLLSDLDIKKYEILFYIIWIVFWLTQGVYVVYYLLINYMGEELIEVRDNKLIITREVFGLKSVSKFDKDSIEEVEYTSGSQKIRFWGSNYKWQTIKYINCKMRFKYKTEVIKFGIDMEDAKVKEELKEINKRLNH